MTIWRRRNWTKVLLIAGALICVSTATFAYYGARPWWYRPVSDPIENVLFLVGADGGVQTDRGVVKVIDVEDCNQESREVFHLANTAFNGGVVDGEFRIRPFTLTGADGDPVQVVVDVGYAELHENYFNSKFWSEGTATVTAFIDGQRVTRVVPVSLHGTIRERDGDYILWAEIRGALKVEEEDSENGTDLAWSGAYGRRHRYHHCVDKSITIFKVELQAEAPVPSANPI